MILRKIFTKNSKYNIVIVIIKYIKKYKKYSIMEIRGELAFIKRFKYVV